MAPLHNPPALAGIRATRAAFPEVRAGRRLRHRVLRRAAGRGGDVRRRPGGGRAAGHPPVRRARDQPRSTSRGEARRFLGPSGGTAVPGRAAPRQRRLGRGDPRRRARGHLDGPDPTRGAGHGHPARRRRRGGAAAPAAPRLRRRPARGAAAPPFGAAGAGRHARLPRPARRGRRRRRAGARRRTRSTATGCASTSARTWPCSAARMRWCSPPGSGRTWPGCARTRCAGWCASASRWTRAATRPMPAAPDGSAPTESRSTVLVVPTDEELAIARQVARCCSAS